MWRTRNLIYILISALILAVILTVTLYFVLHHSPSSSPMEIALVPSPRSYCATRGHWDVDSQSLFYVDIEGSDSTLLRYDYVENKVYEATVVDEPILTFILPLVNVTNQFLVGTKSEAIVIQWDGISAYAVFVRTVFEISTDLTYGPNRFNGAKADPVGNFVGGTQYANDCLNHSTTAYLYHYAPDIGLSTIRSNVFISNGLTWSEKTNKFYYIDSCVPQVNEFDYDIQTGDLCMGNRDSSTDNEVMQRYTRFVSTTVVPAFIDDKRAIHINRLQTCDITNERIAYTASPDLVLDGLTHDNDGNLFITTFGGSKILKVDPVEGTLLFEIEFPADQVTSAAFGGPNFDILFVTTAARGDSQPEAAGHLYKVTGLDSIGSSAMKVNV